MAHDGLRPGGAGRQRVESIDWSKRFNILLDTSRGSSATRGGVQNARAT